jgi:predicted RNase H-like HicB family nuclease
MVRGGTMKEIEYTVIVHEDEDGGYWTDVPTLAAAGCLRDTAEEANENTSQAMF